MEALLLIIWCLCGLLGWAIVIRTLGWSNVFAVDLIMAPVSMVAGPLALPVALLHAYRHRRRAR